jgi:fluoroacetyl-CoA thioesterase
VIDVQLRTGIRHELSYRVPRDRVVPYLLPEAAEFRAMPEVLATGYLVALVEWACMVALRPHLDWPRIQTVGTHVDLSHLAATPPGLTVTIAVELVEVDGRRLVFSVRASDGVDEIAAGTHERHLIATDRFTTRAAAKGQRPYTQIRGAGG